MRRRLPLAVAVGLIIGLASTEAPASASTHRLSAEAAYTAALHLTGTQSVHFVSRAVEGSTVLDVVGDTGTTDGSQVLAIQSGSTIDALEVILIGATGYVRANTTALEKVLGLSASQAKSMTSTWLSFPAGDASYADLVGGLLDKDVPRELAISGPYTWGGSKTIGGHATRAIKGFTTGASNSAPIPIEIYVEKGSKPRPLQEDTDPTAATGTTVNSTVTFSRWGERIHPRAPSKSVPLASLTGG
ncbi:MAG TPA: hypothetical protein VL961_07195 [Acidimicrobiales bacterium]|nr:hypothetical protein [Acidimicrobiales bacterium]